MTKPNPAITVAVRRDPHRSTLLSVKVDIAGLINDKGRPLLTGEKLDQFLAEEITRRVLDFLEKGRQTVKGHP